MAPRGVSPHIESGAPESPGAPFLDRLDWLAPLPAADCTDTAPEHIPSSACLTAPCNLLDTVALYLHIPFCRAKCPYCDFNTYAGMLDLRASYVAALADEIQHAGACARLPAGARRRCRTIFFGGGTPSLLAGAEVARLVETARAAFAVDEDAEISLEANAGALECGRLDDLRAAGVTRLSMGAQSFDAGLLRGLGRLHSPSDVESAFHEARTAGFASISLDLMYALPGQSLATWQETLERACALAPDHLSLYSLIVEEGTPLAKWVDQGKVRPADEDLAADMYELAEARLAAAGYEHYEISNWARRGHACAHNLTYWHNLPYIGLGAGAHGWFAGHRYVEARPIRDYIVRVGSAAGTALTLPAAAIVEDEPITPALEMAETAILALRLAEGLDTLAFAARFGRSFDAIYASQVSELVELGLLARAGPRLRLTARGRLLGNEVFERFLPET